MRSNREGAAALARGALAFVLAAPSLAGASGIAIEHSPMSCVPVDRYARIAARASGDVGRAELQFRTGEAGAWYSVRMAAAEGEWSAFLPRPTAALRELEYRIVMTGPDAASAATAPATVRVAAACEADSPGSVEATIVITVPPGAPVAPPVPAGFSPAGVVAAAEPPKRSRTMKIAGVAAGAAVAGATAAAVARSTAEGPPGGPDVPGFYFNSISPLPGSVLSPNRDPMVVFVVMTYAPPVPLALSWRVELESSAAGKDCLFMTGRVAAAQRPLELALTGPLVAAPDGGCGQQFDTDAVRITIAHGDQLVYDRTLGFSFRFQP